MWKTTLASLLARKRRLFTTSVAVLLGVAFMAGTMVLTDTVSRSFNDLFSSVYAGTDAHVRSAAKINVRGGDESRAKINQSLLPIVAGTPTAEAAEGVVMGYTQIVGRNGKALGNPGMGAPTFGTNWSDDTKLNPFHIVDGRSPRADDEVVIDKASAKKGHLAVGDTIRVLFQGPSQQVKLVGIAKFGSADSPLGASFAMFTLASTQRWVGQPGTFDAIDVRAKPGVSQRALRDAIRARVPNGIEVVTGKAVTKEQQNSIQRGISFFKSFMLVFALIALFVGAFIIHNTFSILVAQRGRELALLRALGASRRQIITSVMAEAVGVGAIASILGLIAGIGVSVLLKGLLGVLGFGIPAAGLLVTARTVATAFIVGVAVSVVSALSPARRAARVPPVAAMRDLQVESRGDFGRRIVVGIVVTAFAVALLVYGLFGHPKNALPPAGLGVTLIFIGVSTLGPVIAGPASRVIGAPITRWKGVAGVIARENALRNPRRTSATAAALMIGVGLIGFVAIFASSAKASFGDSIRRQFTGDFVVASSNESPFGGLSPSIEDKVRAVPGVTAMAPLRLAPVEVNGRRTFLVGVDATNFEKILDADLRSGSMAKLDATSIAVKDRTAKRHHWKLGDSIPVRFAQTGAQQLRLVATFHRSDLLSPFVIGLSAYEKNVADQFDFAVLVQKANDAPAPALRTALERATADYPTAKVQDETQYAKAQTDQVNKLLGLIYVLLLLAVVIAMLGIANTLALSIYERTRELGLLRAVGMVRRQLRSSVRWESVIIALFGAFLGLIIGLFFGYVLVHAASKQGINEFRVPLGQLIFVTVVAGLAGVLAATGPARRVARLDVLSAIATE